MGVCRGGETFENVFFLMPRREDEEERGRALLLLSPSCFVILLSIRSLPFLWFCKWGVCEGGMKHCEPSSVDISEKKREREKRPKDKAALKCSRASAGAAAGGTARVQAQRCNKEEGSWMREREKEKGGGRVEGGWWWVSSDVSLCSVPLGVSHPLMEIHRREWYRNQVQARTEMHETHAVAQKHEK